MLNAAFKTVKTVLCIPSGFLSNIFRTYRTYTWSICFRSASMRMYFVPYINAVLYHLLAKVQHPLNVSSSSYKTKNVLYHIKYKHVRSFEYFNMIVFQSDICLTWLFLHSKKKLNIVMYC